MKRRRRWWAPLWVLLLAGLSCLFGELAWNRTHWCTPMRRAGYCYQEDTGGAA